MKLRIIFIIAAVMSVFLLSCSDEPINSITFQNLASNDVFVNFRGDIIDVPNGSTVQLKDIMKGEYEYETIYEIPMGATDHESDGEMSGNFLLNAGTKVLVVYTSTFITGKYSIYASVTTSDDLSEGGLTDPLGN